MSHYQMFSMADDLTPYVPCQKRSTIRPERALYVPLAKRLQLSTRDSESLQNDGENFFMEGLFTPLGSSSLFDHKFGSFEDADQFHSPFDQQGMLTEQCFSELIKSGLNLPSISGRENASFFSDPLHLLDCSNFENNNTTCLYSDSGFYDCGKEPTSDNPVLLAAIGEECKGADYGVSSKNGAKSYEDFKSNQELHTKMERNFSSPVLPRQSPVTNCGRLSTASNPPVSKTNHPILDCINCQPDAEDLEVAMINESFEEQQKQSKLFEDAAIKNFFYSQSNKSVDNNGLCANLDSSVNRTQSDEKISHERMPYTAAIANNKAHITYSENNTSSREKSIHSNMVMNENDASVKKGDLVDVPQSELSGMHARNYGTVYHRSSLDNNGCAGRIYGDDDEHKLSDFDVEEMILDDAALRRAAQTLSSGRYNLGEPLSEPTLTESRRDFVKAKKERSSSDAIPIEDNNKQTQHLMGSAEEKLDATAAIAFNVVESLFAGGNSLDHSSPLLHTSVMQSDVENDKLLKKQVNCEEVLAPAVQNVFDAYRSSIKKGEPFSSQSDCVSPGVHPDILRALNGATTSSQKSSSGKMSDDVVLPSCDSAVDSWEELDSDDSKLVDEIQSAMGKVRIRKPRLDYFAASETLDADWNEKELPNVLEAYGLPSRVTYDDIKYELAKFDCADVTFQKVDDSHCLIAFSSANAALKALIAARQRSSCAWLRLRSLCDASSAAQDKARLYSASLKPYKPRPQTTMIVARRLVENALGKRSTVSMEQRRAERKRLNEARVQKEAKAAMWEDIS